MALASRPELTHEDRTGVTTSIYREMRVSEPYGHFFGFTPSVIVEALARNENLTLRLIRQRLKLAMQRACGDLDLTDVGTDWKVLCGLNQEG